MLYFAVLNITSVQFSQDYFSFFSITSLPIFAFKLLHLTEFKLCSFTFLHLHTPTYLPNFISNQFSFIFLLINIIWFTLIYINIPTYLPAK